MNKFIWLLILSGLLISGCGKKTAPVSKDSFALPAPGEKSVELTDKGVLLKNTTEKYITFAEKSFFDKEGCLQPFGFIAKLRPGNSFMDDSVETGNKYVYRLSYYDENLDIYSKKSDIHITYSKPLSISEVSYNIDSDYSTELKINLPENLMYYKLFLNSKNIYEGRKNEISIILEKNTLNKLKFVPYDIYGNKGEEFTKTINTKTPLSISSPKDIRIVRGKKFILISWKSVENADRYHIYRYKDDTYHKIGESQASFYKYSNTVNNCKTFGIKAVAEKVESEMADIKICPVE